MPKMDKKAAKKKDPTRPRDPADVVEAVRGAVERTFQATAGGTEGARDRGRNLLDDVASAAQRIRESFDDLRVLEDVRGLRAEIEALSRRVAELEKKQPAAPAAAAKTAPARRAPAKRATTARSTTAKKAPAKPSAAGTAAKTTGPKAQPTAARSKPAASSSKPAASSSKPAASQSKPAASRSKPAASRRKPAAPRRTSGGS